MNIEFENENKVALEDFNGDYFNSTGAEFYREEIMILQSNIIVLLIDG